MKVPRLDHGHNWLFTWPKENDVCDLRGQVLFKFLVLAIYDYFQRDLNGLA